VRQRHLFATFSEVAYIYLLSHVVRLLNVHQVGWVVGLSWLMVLHVVACQVLVWVAVLTEQREFYHYEELGWALIFAANTIASAYLYLTVELDGRKGTVHDSVELCLYLGWVRGIDRGNARRHRVGRFGHR
jgi:hypothetical protein